jgi:hypothetical protein
MHVEAFFTKTPSPLIHSSVSSNKYYGYFSGYSGATLPTSASSTMTKEIEGKKKNRIYGGYIIL